MVVDPGGFQARDRAQKFGFTRTLPDAASARKVSTRLTWERGADLVGTVSAATAVIGRSGRRPGWRTRRHRASPEPI